MFFPLVRSVSARALRVIVFVSAICAVALSGAAFAAAQGSGSQAQSGLSTIQRMDVMRSKLEAMRRSLDSAIAGLNSKDTGDKEKNPDDPRTRLRNLEKEVGSIQSELSDLRSKEDRVEKYDSSKLDTLETSVAELNTRVENVLQATAGARTSGTESSSTYQPKPEKGKRRLFGLLPGKSQDKYSEL